MPRIRTIKPEFFSHEELASKSAHARLLAIGLLTLADCKGRLRWVPMQVHSQVFPWEASVKIQVLLGELIECDYVVHYEHEGKQYVEICNFTKHQRLSGKEASFDSRLPSPDDKSSVLLDKAGGKKSENLDASQGSGENPLGTGEQGNRGTGEHIPKIPGEATAKGKSKRVSVPSQAFLDWYAIYPRKVARNAAIKAYEKAIKLIQAEHDFDRSEAVDWLNRKTEALVSVLIQKDEEFRPHPATWLNAGMYNDEPSATPTAKGNAQQFWAGVFKK
jgi:hypothetical protein